MLRGEMTQNGGWSPERPTMALESWGFESVEPPGKVRRLKIEFKLVANDNEAQWSFLVGEGITVRAHPQREGTGHCV